MIQRVTEASVTVENCRIASIGAGILALIGIEKTDDEASVDRLAQRIVQYRIFPDEKGRMNRDLLSAGGDLLLVPQFTLAADTRKGRRPGFSQAAEPQTASRLFDSLVARLQAQVSHLGQGQFGADMQVALVNDGPVTFWLRSEP